MAGSYDILVKRDALACIDIRPAAAPPTLQAGQVLLQVDQFALTANTITYATRDESAGFWRFFPAPRPWGRLPVWGFADVAASRHPQLAIGERVFGFLPMASHLVVEPAGVTAHGFADAAAGRAALFPLYNKYGRVARDPAREDLHAVLRPLFFTSFALDDHLAEHALFGARSVVLSSASSKTALGTAFLLRERGAASVCGLTADRHLDFVRSTGCFDRVHAYGDIAALDLEPPVIYVDFSGNAAVRHAVHAGLGAQLVHSLAVGSTHWTEHAGQDAPGVPVQHFFGPAQIRQRRAEWGARTLHLRQDAAAMRFESAALGWLAIEPVWGTGPLEQAYRSVLEGRTDPAKAFVVRLRDAEVPLLPEERSAMALFGF